MKWILMLSIIVSCNNNANLVRVPNSSVDSVEEGNGPVERPDLSLEVANRFIIDADQKYGAWRTTLDFSGNIDLNEDSLVFIQKLDEETEEVLFSGYFALGDDLSTAKPLNAEGELNWEEDFAPYYNSGSVLTHNSNLDFDKAAWARALSQKFENRKYFQNVLTHTSGEAINLKTIYEIRRDEETLSRSVTIETIKYHYSFDDDAIFKGKKEPNPTGGSYKFSKVLTVGGPEFVSRSYERMGSSHVDILTHFNNKLECLSFRVISLKESLNKLTAVRSAEGEWKNVDYESQTGLQGVIKHIYGSRSVLKGQFSSGDEYRWVKPALACEDKIQDYFITSATNSSSVRGIKLKVLDDKDEKRHAILRIVKYESY